MKKLITYTAIVLLTVTLFTALSCDNEETDCKCDAEFRTTDGGTYFIPNTPIDCETGYPKDPTTGGGYFYKCKNK